MEGVESNALSSVTSVRFNLRCGCSVGVRFEFFSTNEGKWLQNGRCQTRFGTPKGCKVRSFQC